MQLQGLAACHLCCWSLLAGPCCCVCAADVSSNSKRQVAAPHLAAAAWAATSPHGTAAAASSATQQWPSSGGRRGRGCVAGGAADSRRRQQRQHRSVQHLGAGCCGSCGAGTRRACGGAGHGEALQHAPGAVQGCQRRERHHGAWHHHRPAGAIRIRRAC